MVPHCKLYHQLWLPAVLQITWDVGVYSASWSYKSHTDDANTEGTIVRLMTLSSVLFAG